LATVRWVLAVSAALLVVLAVLLSGLFVVQNSGHVAALSLELPYPPLRWSFVNPTTGEAPSVLALMGLSFLGGFGGGSLLLGLQWWRAAQRVRTLRHELAAKAAPVVAKVPKSAATPSPATRPGEPVTNVATPIRTTANRPKTRDEEPEPVPAGDPDTQTRNW